jgi:2-succinyl-6-hydroxy-2,4-cyclohexadiene-1-carboxylate synthase
VDVKFYRTDEIIKHMLFIIDYFEIEKVILAGYSMGGRAALSFASAHPEKISALILESTSAGIENEDDRKVRTTSDEHLACFIESHSIEEFINKWMGMELFKSQKSVSDEKLKNLKTAKLKNSTTGLANSLRGFGSGVMPYLGNEITKMNFPVLLVSGELDSKFTQLNSRLVKQFPDADHIIVDGAGHTIHFESPDEYNSKLNHFLKQF